eukprot:jgi/Botrbrau1/20592/Bobra.113_1s0018.1
MRNVPAADPFPSWKRGGAEARSTGRTRGSKKKASQFAPRSTSWGGRDAPKGITRSDCESWRRAADPAVVPSDSEEGTWRPSDAHGLMGLPRCSNLVGAGSGSTTSQGHFHVASESMNSGGREDSLAVGATVRPAQEGEIGVEGEDEGLGGAWFWDDMDAPRYLPLEAASEDEDWTLVS